MDIQLGNLANLNLLWGVAAVVGVMIAAAVARRRALARFATANLIGRLTAADSSARRVAKAALVTVTLLALVTALLDVRWGKAWHEAPEKGIEVVFVLDVSRSMLAEDATPNRLERAKQQIGDMVDAMAGDRVGLVAFAGDARQLVPLTSHYHDFKQTLGEVRPQDVDRGGSRLGDALKLAANGFLDLAGDHKAVVVFTDGEDQESEPVKTAEQLYRDRGIRIFTVGLGDMDQGARIPVQQSGRARSYLQYQGQQVWSKMNGGVLKQVALATHGAYIPAGTKQVDMAQVYHNHVAQVEQQDFETARINSYVPRYQWFVGLGLLLLVLDTLLPATRTNRQAAGSSAGRRLLSGVFRSTTNGSRDAIASRNETLGKSIRQENESGKNSNPAGKAAAAACLAMLLLLPQAASAVEPANLVRQANQSLRAGKVDQALADYRQAAESDPDRPELLYNQAVALYRKGQYEQARQLFAETAALADEQLDAKARYNLANCDYAEAVQLADKDKPAAIERLQSAISHYRADLAVNSTDTDARANIQLAQILIDQLRQEEDQQQDQQQDQQDQQQQDKQNSASDQNKQNQQDEQAKQEQDKEKQDQANPDAQNEQNENQDQQDKDRQKGEAKDSSPDKRNEQQTDENESGQQDKQDEQPPSQDEQSQPTQSQDEPQPQDEDTQLQPPKTDAAQPQNSQQQPVAGQPGGAPQYGHDDAIATADARPMTKEEAQKMLQAVRDRELLRRLEQQRKSQRHRVPVDRDW